MTSIAIFQVSNLEGCNGKYAWLDIDNTCDSSGHYFHDKDHENNFKLLHINNSSQNEDKLNSDWLSNCL